MDTLIEVTIIEKDSEKANRKLDEVFKEFKRIERLFTSYDSVGEIFRINKSNGKKIQINSEVYNLIDTSFVFSKISDGAFDVSIWPLIRIWGFGIKPQIPSQKEIDSTLPLIDYKRIKLYQKDHYLEFSKSGMGIDVGAIAKGYALDKASDILKKAGIPNFLINAGGNIIVSGTREDKKKWNVGIQHPREDKLLETLELTDCAIATSGDYQRYFIQDGVRYHHILEPSFGNPARKSISTTVIVDSNSVYNSGTTSDALSTALFVLGPEKGMEIAKKIKGIKVIFITPKMKIIKNY